MHKTAISLVIFALIAGCGAEPMPDSDDEPVASAESALLTGCVYGWNLSIPRESATCTETVQKNWYLRLTCERPTGKQVKVNGTAVYGPGTGTSICDCPYNTEIVDSTLVEF